MGVTVLCTKCKHYESSLDTADGADRCPAFPDGIPPEYLSGAELHIEAVEGQKSSTVFEKRDDVSQEQVDVVLDNWDMMRAQVMYDKLPDTGRQSVGE